MSAYLAILAGIFLLLTLGGMMPWWFGLPLTLVVVAGSYLLVPKNQYVARYK